MEENKILNSWKINSDNWIDSIDNNKIKSRGLITNQAIIDAIKEYNPLNVLDLGCGEGWLTRELNNNNIKTIGIDGTERLIENALQKGGEFFHITYGEIINGKEIPSEPFDAVVANFSLFDKDETEELLMKLSEKISQYGHLFIQTIHPYNLITNEHYYKSRWESNSWKGLEGNYSDPFYWYNRTLEDWITVFVKSNYILKEIKEPVNPMNPNTEKPQSIIFVVEKK